MNPQKEYSVWSAGGIGAPKNLHAQALGRLGGKTKGKAKARTSEQARAAVMVRWAKAKAKQ